MHQSRHRIRRLTARLTPCLDDNQPFRNEHDEPGNHPADDTDLPPDLCIVVPAFNEAANLDAFYSEVSALVRSFLDELCVTKPVLIVDASSGINLEPSLRRWNSDWRFPEQGRIVWWSMTAPLKGFYDFVAENYSVGDSVGSQKWAVYRRRSNSSVRHISHTKARPAAASLRPPSGY